MSEGIRTWWWCPPIANIDSQADGDQEQLVRVHLREVQPVQMVSIAENAIEKRHPQLLNCFKDDKYGDKNRRCHSQTCSSLDTSVTIGEALILLPSTHDT